jgi:hypothetical protein
MARATNVSNTQERNNTMGSSLVVLILVGQGRSCLQTVPARTVKISLGAKEKASNVLPTPAVSARRQRSMERVNTVHFEPKSRQMPEAASELHVKVVK